MAATNSTSHSSFGKSFKKQDRTDDQSRTRPCINNFDINTSKSRHSNSISYSPFDESKVDMPLTCSHDDLPKQQFNIHEFDAVSCNYDQSITKSERKYWNCFRDRSPRPICDIIFNLCRFFMGYLHSQYRLPHRSFRRLFSQFPYLLDDVHLENNHGNYCLGPEVKSNVENHNANEHLIEGDCNLASHDEVSCVHSNQANCSYASLPKHIDAACGEFAGHLSNDTNRAASRAIKRLNMSSVELAKALSIARYLLDKRTKS
jgi:hypothetical protein